MESQRANYVKAVSGADDRHCGKLLPEATGWLYIFSVILVVVTGGLTLGYALAQIGGVGGSQSRRGVDLASTMRPFSHNGGPALMRTAGSPQAAAPAGFFLYIGGSSTDERTAHLEKKGFAGIFAVPLPSPNEFDDRTCRLIPFAVSGESGDEVTVPNCTPRDGDEDICDPVKVNAVGIADLLSIAAAPPVIDYIALDGGYHDERQQEVTIKIMENFPFDEFCSRAWTVHKHGTHDNDFQRIKHWLEVAQGCRVKEEEDELWARCPCDKKDSATPSISLTDKSQAQNIKLTMTADGHASIA
jgi:hypothetical protein